MAPGRGARGTSVSEALPAAAGPPVCLHRQAFGQSGRRRLMGPWGWETQPSAAGGERPPGPAWTVPGGGQRAGGREAVRAGRSPPLPSLGDGLPGQPPSLTLCCHRASASPSDGVRATRPSSCFCNLCLRAASRGRWACGSTRPYGRTGTMAALRSHTKTLPLQNLPFGPAQPPAPWHLQLHVDLGAVAERGLGPAGGGGGTRGQETHSPAAAQGAQRLQEVLEDTPLSGLRALQQHWGKGRSGSRPARRPCPPPRSSRALEPGHASPRGRALVSWYVARRALSACTASWTREKRRSSSGRCQRSCRRRRQRAAAGSGGGSRACQRSWLSSARLPACASALPQGCHPPNVGTFYHLR